MSLKSTVQQSSLPQQVKTVYLLPQLTFFCADGRHRSLPIEGENPRDQESLNLEEEVQGGGGVTDVPLLGLQEVVLRDVLQVGEGIGGRVSTTGKCGQIRNIVNKEMSAFILLPVMVHE